MVTKNHGQNLDDDWLRGFIESEATFSQNKATNQPIFQITQHYCDKTLLFSIKSKLGVGYVYKEFRDDGRKLSIYSLRNKKHIAAKVLPLLEKSFVFSKVDIFDVSRYRGWLKTHFPDYAAPHNLEVSGCDLGAYNLSWLHGFTDGDGSFYFVCRKQKDYRHGYQIQAVFDLCQKVEVQELQRLGNHLFGTAYSVVKDKTSSHLRVVSASTCFLVVCNAFRDGQPLKSRKRIDYLLWNLGVHFIMKKYHTQAWGKQMFTRILALQRYYRNH